MESSYIVINSAIFFSEEKYYADIVRPNINGMMWECFFSEWDWEHNKGTLLLPYGCNIDRRDDISSFYGLVAHFQLFSAAFERASRQTRRVCVLCVLAYQYTTRYSVMVLDYFTADQTALVLAQYAQAVLLWGWNDYVTDIYLQGIRRDIEHLCDLPH